MDGLILAIDCGTQSVRALLFDRGGNLLAKAKEEFEPYYSTQPGWAEIDPEVYWNSACAACRRVRAEAPALWKTVTGVVVTTLRDTCVFLDKDGKVLRDAIVCLDQRQAKCVQPLKAVFRAMFALVGMTRQLRWRAKKPWPTGCAKTSRRFGKRPRSTCLFQVSSRTV
jgi:sugar (pentulose or hexulose) kinase